MSNVHKELERIIGSDKYMVIDVSEHANDLGTGQTVFMLQRENKEPVFIWCQIPSNTGALSSAYCKDSEHLSYTITPTAAILLVIEKIVSGGP